MKILFVSECYPTKEQPQYCIYLEQQAQALTLLGHTVDVLHPVNVTQSNTVFLQNGIRIYQVPLRPLKTRLQKTLITNSMDWRSYDVVSLHLLSLSMMEAILAFCKKNHIPSVIHFHGLNVWKNCYQKNDILHKLHYCFSFHKKKKVYQNATAVVGVSNLVCEQVKQHLKTKHLYTVYNGVDPSVFFDMPKTKNERFRIVCVANLIPIKGQQYLIEAIKHLITQKYCVELILIGAGPSETALRALTEKYMLTDIVEFKGVLPYSHVAEEMRKADMFIMPSFYEAFGCVFLEAMSCGTLTCGCFATGAEEIIQNKINGFLVPQKDATAISKTIQFAIENPETAHKIAIAGISRTKAFSWISSAKSLEQVYQKISYK